MLGTCGSMKFGGGEQVNRTAASAQLSVPEFYLRRSLAHMMPVATTHCLSTGLQPEAGRTKVIYSSAQVCCAANRCNGYAGVCKCQGDQRGPQAAPCGSHITFQLRRILPCSFWRGWLCATAPRHNDDVAEAAFSASH